MQLEAIENTSTNLRNINKYEMIVNHFELGMKLAWKLLNSWQVRLPQDDVKSLVGISLCEAAQNYDGRPNVQFQTFLYYYLRGRLLREISENVKSSNITKQLLLEDSEISSNVEARENIKNFAPEDNKNAEQLIIDREERVFINKSLLVLDDLESEIIKRHYLEEESLIDLAEELGYCRCHLSRVKRRALEKLKKAIDIQDDLGALDNEDIPKLIKSKVLGDSYTGGRGRRKGKTYVDSREKLAA